MRLAKRPGLDCKNYLRGDGEQVCGGRWSPYSCATLEIWQRQGQAGGGRYVVSLPIHFVRIQGHERDRIVSPPANSVGDTTPVPRPRFWNAPRASLGAFPPSARRTAGSEISPRYTVFSDMVPRLVQETKEDLRKYA